MTQIEDKKNSDGDILFADESEKKSIDLKKWKLLIIDDDEDVHTMTKLVLSDYTYEEASLDFISGYSGEDAKKLVKEHPDAACMLLDVVMETAHSGLDVARYVREETKNSNLRIILRTGQPGKAPEKKVILDYDINDYKEKTELTSQKLFTTITTAIRSYIHLKKLEDKQDEIAEKNIRLNQEIARRIVAEANLEKYNKSLERMIENKSDRLKKALNALKNVETELKQTEQLSCIGEMTSKAVFKMQQPVDNVKENLNTIDKYRSDITHLLEQYEILTVVMNGYAKTFSKNADKIIHHIKDIKNNINLDMIIKTYPDIINDSTEEMDQIVNIISGLKKFIKLTKENRQKVHLNTIIKNVLKKESKKYAQEIDIQTNFCTHSEIEISPESIKEVFQSIFKNSFHAIEPFGIISISTMHDKNFITIEISDTGKGILPKNMDKVFEPYFSCDTKNRLGMGLFISKKIIQSHNGTIEIESTHGQGTSVIIKLPVNAGA
ncbi:MAG: ATP-binding protein [Thermodesulfobacteriota bacterium]|nr:ATP-binding protein [Thermodesulfobacteriota bacterium]